jgi:arginine deiminase
LELALGHSVQIIYSGGSTSYEASREQWNDSTNTLAVAPGKVIVYNRNQLTNKILRKAGIEIIEIEGSELVRGRGGPRCMSMPLERENI